MARPGRLPIEHAPEFLHGAAVAERFEDAPASMGLNCNDRPVAAEMPVLESAAPPEIDLSCEDLEGKLARHGDADGHAGLIAAAHGGISLSG